MNIPVVKLTLNECRRLQRIETLTRTLLSRHNKKKLKQPDDPLVEELRALMADGGQ